MAIEDSQIATRLASVRERISAAAQRAGRRSEEVRLLLASKTQPPETIRAAYLAGAREFGENYVQETMFKQAILMDLNDITWHLIGHLQTNKVLLAARAFALIQSLDSIHLYNALARAGRPVQTLIEVNLGAENSKTGIKPDRIEALISTARKSVAILGLMAIPPRGPTPEHSRPFFARLRNLRDQLAVRTGLALSELSMGMTEDFEVAVEEGATMVRVGRAVFGERY